MARDELGRVGGCRPFHDLAVGETAAPDLSGDNAESRLKRDADKSLKRPAREPWPPAPLPARRAYRPEGRAYTPEGTEEKTS